MSSIFFRFSIATLFLGAVLAFVPIRPVVAFENQRVIRMANNPSLSPDGSLLAFSWSGEIWTVSIEGGEATRLTQHPANDSQPKFSPDGNTLAFISDRDGSDQIYTMPARGGIPEQKTFHSEDYQIADWFPDGQSILAISQRDHFWKNPERLIQVDVTQRTSETVLADAYASDAKVSPDGKRILLVREGERWWRKGYEGERASQIWELDVASRQFTELLHEGVDCRWPLWMPNGKGFYFTKGDIHGFDLWRQRIARNGEESKVPKRLAGFPEDSIVQPTLSRDGSTIVFRHLFDFYRFRPGDREKPTRLEIRVAKDIVLSKDRLRRSFSKADQVSFTDDGLELAFIAGGDLWVMDTELKEPIRVTHTDGTESNPVFAPDGKSLWFARSIDGQVDIWKIERKDPSKFWWQQNAFVETQITRSPDAEFDLQFTPNGKNLLFQIAYGDLIRYEIANGESQKLYDGFAELEYSISPDSRWIAYSARDEYFNSDIWLIPTDGNRIATNVSRHPDNDLSPLFSPDGKILAYTGTRGDDEVDVCFVYLQETLDEQTSRERRLQKAVETMKKKREASAKAPNGSNGSKSTSENASNNKPKESTKENTDSTQKLDHEKDGNAPNAMVNPIVIDLDEIHKRVRKISIPDSSERNLLFSSDGKRLAFEATVEGKRGWHTVEFPDQLKPKFLTTNVFFSAKWSKAANGIVGLYEGVPAKLDAGEKLQTYAFTARHECSASGRFREGFHAAWLRMRNIWYDPRMGGRNWDEIRRKYAEVASESQSERDLATIIEMMLGELNGSHLGFTPSVGTTQESSDTPEWKTQIAHLGVRWDESYRGPGLRIRDVIPDGPADRHESQLVAGDIVLAIDGKSVDPAMDLTAILDGVLERDIELTVQRDADEKVEQEELKSDTDNSSKQPRIVRIRPITYARARTLLYEHWLEHNRQLVDKQTDGKLGYLHIRSMDTASFHEFESQLYQVGYGRDGLIIDVRDNGGGFTTDLLLTALTQPQHAITVPRGGKKGYPQDRFVFATWSKPIVVLCNQNSYSNAEIFSHAIKMLGRGKLVGVRTAGGVVSTSSAKITDVGVIRTPFRGWFSLESGRDLELNGAEPDVVIWPQPDELPKGIDRQLEAAAKILLEEVASLPSPPNIQYATER
jgi:tricorn protease